MTDISGVTSAKGFQNLINTKLPLADTWCNPGGFAGTVGRWRLVSRKQNICISFQILHFFDLSPAHSVLFGATKLIAKSSPNSKALASIVLPTVQVQPCFQVLPQFIVLISHYSPNKTSNYFRYFIICQLPFSNLHNHYEVDLPTLFLVRSFA